MQAVESSTEGAACKPVVFAKFQGEGILAEMGRFMFSLLNAFASSGYSILLFDNIPANQMGLYALNARSLATLTVTNAVPETTADKFYLFDVRDRDLARRPWLKQIQVKFDVFSSYWGAQPVLMPFPIHPVHSTPDLRERLTRLRSSERRMRIFFSGETEGYTRSRINYPTPMLPRQSVINAVREQLGDKVIFVQDQGTLDRVLSADYVNKCVILDTSKIRIPDQDWLDVLSKADFFLAPPGIVNPMCHNSVEALALGAIPVINYPEWFDPSLQHMRNCVTFDDRTSLITCLASVFAMDDARIAKMRECAISYFDEHLTNRSFLAKIESRPERKIEVLIILERYVAKNAHRLNGRSVIIRGASDAGALRRLRRFIQS